MRSEWAELGKPPNFDTCTRDTFAEGTSFEAAQVVRILTGVARACAHLHSRGFLHGDLYAHNTMVNRHGTAKVGDFGAAFNFEPLGAASSYLFERIEVRAFGCMAEDLCRRLSRDSFLAPGSPLAALNAIITKCFASEVASRPSFNQLLERLEAADDFVRRFGSSSRTK